MKISYAVSGKIFQKDIFNLQTKAVGSNPARVYSIQHYVIKFVSDLRQVSGFLQVPSPIKLITTI